MTKYTLKNPHVINVEIFAPMEYSLDKDLGVFGGKWNREKSFTPRWLAPTVTEEYIGPIWPKTEAGKNHLGVAVTSRGLDENGDKTDWSQYAIIDYGYLWDDEGRKTGQPSEMVIQVKNGKYNARLVFKKIGPMQTELSVLEWGDGVGLTDEDVSHIGGIKKFASEVAKQFAKEARGKDDRNLKQVKLGNVKGAEILRGHAAARARKISANKMLERQK
ncbi:hypothetical protein FACS189421_02770 [Bacteroidia bacterium]|nr:hypothetical protein FACS189421_02770 [Bacteroidia bacterium]